MYLFVVQNGAGSVLFNDALNTFSYGYMASEVKNICKNG